MKEYVGYKEMLRLLEDHNNNVVGSGNEIDGRIYVIRCQDHGGQNCNEECSFWNSSRACVGTERGK